MSAQMGGFNCPHCGQHYSLTPQQAPQYAGQTIACTVCKKQFTVPMDVGASGMSPIPPIPMASPVGPAIVNYPPQSMPPMAAYASPMVAPPTSGLAIASMICGLLFFIPFVTGLLGVIFGIIGIKQTSENRMQG